MGEAQLDENSMDFREGRAVSSSLVVTKMKARIGGGGAFLCMAPVGLEVRGSNRQGLRRGNIWGVSEGGDKLSGVFINLRGQAKEPSKIA